MIWLVKFNKLALSSQDLISCRYNLVSRSLGKTIDLSHVRACVHTPRVFILNHIIIVYTELSNLTRALFYVDILSFISRGPWVFTRQSKCMCHILFSWEVIKLLIAFFLHLHWSWAPKPNQGFILCRCSEFHKQGTNNHGSFTRFRVSENTTISTCII